MESARSMFCSSPPFRRRTHHWNTFPSSSSTSVLMLCVRAAPTVASWSSSFSAQNSPTSVLLQEKHDEYRPLLQMSKEEKTSQMDMASVHEENNTGNADQLVHDFRQHLQLWPRLRTLLTSLPTEEIAASSTLQHLTVDLERPADGAQCNAASLAKKALSASKQAASVAEELKSIKADDYDDSLPFSLASTSFADPSVGSNKFVRSTRLLDRRSKQRKVPKSKVKDEETCLTRKDDAKEKKKINKELDQNDPQHLFSWSPETKQLLTLEQESQLVAHSQELLRLEELKTRLQYQFGREPTITEWAEGVGLNRRALQEQIHCGNKSREKLIQANLRLVVHVAKSYQGRGLSLHDLVQEGRLGLLKSVKKYKPRVGCRFGTYAYCWIRQTIRKAISQNSRTIRLPESVFTLLGKVMEAKKLYIQEGNLHPTKEELARRVGITVDKINNLLFVARYPISIQQTVWADQDTTFQEITADSAIETPDVSVAKQLMRRHVLYLLSMLRPKERRIIRLRFVEQKSLSDVGDMFGLSKERVRQLESRALFKLKRCLVNQGLDAYVDLLV
ncbi:RNA polymerase sigma factor sigF, chloroplastic-like isoform X2 [Gastrolobium bilobum]|uniref:RNA polymerase sigma factor sigF, chloroplastic-like isoform X2 n=1 Tax=Gastrolobium bilobum TaxID=150636 RepID=UPI002AB0C852|nr:RNA polymerase sigma factor sigF, chloroplastic-like isoform X2 [Gastrolobium bilobum]